MTVAGARRGHRVVSERGCRLRPSCGRTAGCAVVVLLAGCGWFSNQPGGKASLVESARSEVERGPVRVVVEVTPKTARLSDTPRLTLTIDALQGVEVHEPPFGESLGAFLIRDFEKPLPQVREGREIRRYHYTLEPTEAGTLTVAPISVTFADARNGKEGAEHTISTEPLSIEVTTELAEGNVSLADLRPPAAPVPLPEPPSRWLWWVLGGALGLVAMGVALFWWARRKRSEVAVPQLSPRERARLELAQLKREGLQRQDVKHFYVELTGIVRRFIERTTGVHAPEQTTEEFLHAIQHHRAFAIDERQRLQEFLEAADLVKFAGFQPRPQDIEGSLQGAERFIGLDVREAA